MALRSICAALVANLMVGHHALTSLYEQHRAPARQGAGWGPWDLQSIFLDEPRGAYLDFMKPLLYANYLSYKTADGPRNDPFIDPVTATITEEWSGGRHWERLYDVEDDPVAGPHMRAFVDHAARRAILAFRGSCFDALLPGCRADMNVRYLNDTPSVLDYQNMAVARVNNAQQYLAGLADDYSFLVTGHSLGAMLAPVACRDSAGECQVVVLAGHGVPPYTMQPENVFALYDPIDLGVHSSQISYAELGALTLCVYDLPPPQSCVDCVAQQPGAPALGPRVLSSTPEAYAALQDCRFSEDIPFGHYKPLCWDDTHWLDHWAKDILPRNSSGGGPFLPNCTVLSEGAPQGVPMVAR